MYSTKERCLVSFIVRIHTQTKQIACYVPNDNWNGYLLTESSPTPIQVYEDEEVAGENK